MTKEQKRRKIAEKCGWTDIHTASIIGRYRAATIGIKNGDEITGHLPIPNYFNSLDAMAEAEAINKDTLGYYLCLERVMNTLDSTKVISATASDRAEAFGLHWELW